MDCSNCVIPKSLAKGAKIAIRRQIKFDNDLVFVMDRPRSSFLDPLLMESPTSGVFSRFIKEKFDIVYVKNCVQAGRIEKVAMDREATGCCRPTFIKDLRTKRRKVVVACGNNALKALGYDRKAGNSVGWVHYNEEIGASVLATYDPHDVEDSPDSLCKDFIWTIQRAEQILRGDAPDRNMLCPQPYTVAESIPHLKGLLDKVADDSMVSADIETGGLEFHNPEHEIIMVGFYNPSVGAVIVPEHVQFEKGYRELVQAFNDRVNLILHNGKFDTKFVKFKTGVDLTIAQDTMVMHQMIDERTGIHGMERLVRVYLNYAEYWADLKNYVKKRSDSYRLIPFNILAQYLAYDLKGTYELYFKFKGLLRDDTASTVYPWGIEMTQEEHINIVLNPVNNVLKDVEIEGSVIDPEIVKKLVAETEPEVAALLKEIEKEIADQGGLEVDAGSPSQLLKGIHACGIMLQEDSTDQRVMKDYADKPLIKKILTFRKRRTMLNNFYKGTMESMIDLGDGHFRLFTLFSIVGTIGSRWSSSNKNLQQVPRKDKYKKSFVPMPGFYFQQNDFSGLEARIAAMFSRDKVLADACLADLHSTVSLNAFKDYHDELAGMSTVEEVLSFVKAKAMLLAVEGAVQEVIDKSEGLKKCKAIVISHLRSSAKCITFGIFFGRGARALATQELMCTPQEAQHFIDEYFKLFPGLHRWIENVKRLVQDVGIIISPCGKVRDLRYWRFSPNIAIRRRHFARACRQAVNFLTQTFAGTVNNKAFVAGAKYLKEHGLGRVFGAVHDSTISMIKRLPKIRTMRKHTRGFVAAQENAYVSDFIPFAVDGEIGENWYEVDCSEKVLTREAESSIVSSMRSKR